MDDGRVNQAISMEPAAALAMNASTFAWSFFTPESSATPLATSTAVQSQLFRTAKRRDPFLCTPR